MNGYEFFINILKFFQNIMKYEIFPSSSYISHIIKCEYTCPPLWARRLHARLSRSGPGFDPQSGQVS